MERWLGRVALVTGASFGMGASISKMLVRHGMVVYGCGRNYDNLLKIQNEIEGSGSFIPVKCDVSSETDVKNMVSQIEHDNKGADVIINNAGLAHYSPLLEGETRHWQEMMNVNILGVCLVSRECFKSMKNRKIDDGQIVNINSVLGHKVPQSSSNIHFYAATKHAVKAITEGIRLELRSLKSNIRICEISPAMVATEFQNRASGGNFCRDGIPSLEAQDIADAVEYVLSAPSHVQVHDIILRHVDALN